MTTFNGVGFDRAIGFFQRAGMGFTMYEDMAQAELAAALRDSLKALYDNIQALQAELDVVKTAVRPSVASASLRAGGVELARH